jgi:trk system potassium uptake protein TrkA
MAHRHTITMIEPQEEQCHKLANSLDIPVVCGSSCNLDVLRTADCQACDAFVAVTGNDEHNLIACQLAKKEFGVKHTVARVSNPKNRDLLHNLGVDTVVCGTDNLSHILEREIETETIRQLLSLGGGTASLNEILLPEDFKYAGQPLRDIPMPGDAILVSITRDTEFIIPHGNTILLPWDRILCLTQDSTLHLLIEEWGLNKT